MFGSALSLSVCGMAAPSYACWVVDAFTPTNTRGNPAAVVVVPGREWPSSTWMQRCAMEFNLSETAFVLLNGEAGGGCDGPYGLRWMTPTVEVELCGHATLASYVTPGVAPEGGPRRAARC